MTYRRIRFGRSSAIILFATTIFCLHPRSIAAQDLEAKPASAEQAAGCSGDLLEHPE